MRPPTVTPERAPPAEGDSQGRDPRTDDLLARADPSLLVDLVRGRMPFGRYANRRYVELPESYLTWFSQRGWPRGRLGMILATLHEIRINHLGSLLRGIERHLAEGEGAE